MNKYLQQDTPTTETLLFKTSYIRMTESICTNIPKTYGFSSLQEERGREGGDKKKKKKGRNPQLFESKDLFNENKGIERKNEPCFWIWQTILGVGRGFLGTGGCSPSPVGQGEARVRGEAGPQPWFPHIPLHFFSGERGENEGSPLGAARVTEVSHLYKLHISSCEK